MVSLNPAHFIAAAATAEEPAAEETAKEKTIEASVSEPVRHPPGTFQNGGKGISGSGGTSVLRGRLPAGDYVVDIGEGKTVEFSATDVEAL